MKKQESKFYVYILKCCDGSYYTGYTGSLLQRLKHHYIGEGCIYTYMRQPVELVFLREFSRKYDALRVEKQIKSWSKKKKEALIYSEFELLQALSKNSHHKSTCLKFYPLDESTK